MNEITELIKRLRAEAEDDEYESNRKLFAEAADTLEAKQAENERLTTDRDEWKDATLEANENQRRADNKAAAMKEERDEWKDKYLQVTAQTCRAEDEVERLTAKLAALEGQEAVAWSWQKWHQRYENGPGWYWHISEDGDPMLTTDDHADIRNYKKLYPAAGAACTPLTDEHLNRLANQCTPNTETGSLNYNAFGRAVEAAHGIKERL